jgi:hypothetical protein
LVAAAACALDGLQRAVSPDAVGRKSGLTNLALFGVLVFEVLIGVGVVYSAQPATLRVQFGWGAVLFSLALGLVFLGRSRRVKPGWLTLMFVVLGLGELSAVNAIGLAFRPFGDVVNEGAGAASYLTTRDEGRPFRVYSPSYSLPQQVAGLFRLELADGVDPLQLEAYAAYMRRASGVPSTGYSVTLPPFANGEPASDNSAYLPDARRLGLLNVQYVVAEYALPSSQMRLLARFGETRIYENPFSLPRAWVQAENSPPGLNLTSSPVVVIEPNRVRVPAAQGAGLLVLSELAYPGWTVRVDGQSAEIEVVGGLLRGVRLGPGQHAVVFEFRPPRVLLGLGLASLAWLFVLSYALWQWFGRWRRRW